MQLDALPAAANLNMVGVLPSPAIVRYRDLDGARSLRQPANLAQAPLQAQIEPDPGLAPFGPRLPLRLGVIIVDDQSLGFIVRPSAAHDLQLRLVHRCAGVVVRWGSVKRVTIEWVAVSRRTFRGIAIQRIVPCGRGSYRSAARRLVTVARVLHTRHGWHGNEKGPAEPEADS